MVKVLCEGQSLDLQNPCKMLDGCGGPPVIPASKCTEIRDPKSKLTERLALSISSGFASINQVEVKDDFLRELGIYTHGPLLHVYIYTHLKMVKKKKKSFQLNSGIFN